MTPSPTPDRQALRWTGVCLDCPDVEQLAEFYGQLLGWEITGRDSSATREGGAGWINMRVPAGGVGLNFQAEEGYEPPVWPEQPGEQAKMLHFEIHVDDLDVAVARTIAAGGREADHQPQDRAHDELRVMLDPAGHPFCLFTG